MVFNGLQRPLSMCWSLAKPGRARSWWLKRFTSEAPVNRARSWPSDCGAIPHDLLESEFFGHERGAFTGAQNRKVGLLESASHGTFFLDELAQLPMPLQAKLLRVLQERRVRRVGVQPR